jgi:hypothetical protein
MEIVDIGTEENGMEKYLGRSENKQERQCTYNVTMRHVVAIYVAVEKQYVIHILRMCLQPVPSMQ